MGLKIRSILYALATYTTYTTYSYVMAQRAIDEREKEFNINGKDNRFDVLEIHGRYENPFREYRPQTLYEFFVMRLIELSEFGPRGGVPRDPELRVDELHWVQPSVEYIKNLRDFCLKSGMVAYTWLGQSCGLFQSGGKVFLMDPLFEDSIVNDTFGPRRVVPCPLKIDQIVDSIKPDYILVSHDHPDHLGDDSATKLSTIEGTCKWIVPNGIGEFLSSHGVKLSNVIELKWWERVRLDEEFEIVCLPAMHWSGRMLLDSNKSLWCSFMILKNGKSLFYHGGDTGYATGIFSKIGELYGPVKFAALPIGQYCPEWHQRPRHISPAESVKIMKEMKIHKMVGVHWGTFVLSSEHYLEPGKLLLEEATKNDRINNIIVPSQGRTIMMKEDKINFSTDDEIDREDKFCVVYK